MSRAREGEKNPKAQKVVCTNTGMIFNTINDALKWLKITLEKLET